MRPEATEEEVPLETIHSGLGEPSEKESGVLDEAVRPRQQRGHGKYSGEFRESTRASRRNAGTRYRDYLTLKDRIAALKATMAAVDAIEATTDPSPAPPLAEGIDLETEIAEVRVRLKGGENFAVYASELSSSGESEKNTRDMSKLLSEYPTEDLLSYLSGFSKLLLDIESLVSRLSQKLDTAGAQLMRDATESDELSNGFASCRLFHRSWEEAAVYRNAALDACAKDWRDRVIALDGC